MPARATPPGLRIERVDSPALLHVWEQTVCRGYPLEGLEDVSLAGALALPHSWQSPHYGAWVGFENGHAVVASSAWAPTALSTSPWSPPCRTHGARATARP